MAVDNQSWRNGFKHGITDTPASILRDQAAATAKLTARDLGKLCRSNSRIWIASAYLSSGKVAIEIPKAVNVSPLAFLNPPARLDGAINCSGVLAIGNRSRIIHYRRVVSQPAWLLPSFRILTAR